MVENPRVNGLKDTTHPDEPMDMEEPVETEEEEGKGYEESVLRKPRRTELEDLLVSELAISIFSIDPVMKIRHIFEGFLLLSEDEQMAVVDDHKEAKMIKRYYSVATALLYVKPRLFPPWGEIAFIPFSFPKEQAPTYLDFVDTYLDLRFFYKDWPGTTNMSRQFYLVNLYGYLTSGRAFYAHCLVTKDMYTRRVMPLALKLLRNIMWTFISSEAWEEVMGGELKKRLKGAVG